MSKVIIEYLDEKQKTRWGYITDSTHKALKAFKSEDSKDLVVTIYLMDGTTGSARLGDIRMVERFARADSIEEVEPTEELLLENDES